MAGLLQPSGIRFSEGELLWVIECPQRKDFPALVRGLENLLLPGGTIYVETDAKLAEKVLAFYTALHDEPKVKVARINLLPPHIFHLPLDGSTIEPMAQFFDKLEPREICQHFQVYRQGRMLLSWHEAFYEAPLYVSREVPEERVNKFCDPLAVRYHAGAYTTEDV